MAAIDTLGLGCVDCSCNFRPFHFKRRAVGEHDIHIEMKYCGVCHSDLHFARGDMTPYLGPPAFPMVPGHELAGIVAAVGSKVTKFKVGDPVGVGCFVDSCKECTQCKAGDEQYCEKGPTLTYGAPANAHGRSANAPGHEKDPTFGGYCSQMVVHEDYAIKVPKGYPLEMAGPLMCSAITMYDPLRRLKAGKGTRVGIIGLGGLGGIGAKIAKALGCHVAVVSRSDKKRALALSMGADAYVASEDPAQMAAAAKSFDVLMNTIAANHDISPYLSLLATGGTLVAIGLATEPWSVPAVPLLFSRTGIQGSLIGGIRATQEVVDLCAKEGIFPEVRVVPCTELNQVFERLDESNALGVRYVLDLGNTLTEAHFPKLQEVDPPVLSTPGQRATAGELAKTLTTLAQPVAFFAFGVVLGVMIMQGAASARAGF